MPRLVPTLAVVLLMLVPACAQRTQEPGGGASPTATPADSEDPQTLAQSCTFTDAGLRFVVPYPSGWHSNTSEGAAQSCFAFHHEPFDLQPDTEVFGIDILVDLENAPYAVVSKPPSRGADVLSNSETSVAGRAAVRREVRLTDEAPLGEPGTRRTVFVVDLGERSILASTAEEEGLDYTRNVEVLAAMMAQLRITSDDSDVGLSPIGEARTEGIESDRFPAEGLPSLLTDVRVATHDGFDRVVFEFRGDGAPEYKVEWVQRPIRHSPSGNEVSIGGRAFLSVSMSRAAGVDLSGSEAIRTYTGPDRITPPRTKAVVELVKAEDFESVLTWVVALDAKGPYSIATLRGPVRVVVDVRHA